MTRWRSLVLVTLATALLAACGTSKISTVQVEGVVTNATGAPLAGVRVLIPGKSLVTTDTDGRFVFENVTTPYTLIVEYDTDKYMIYEGVTRTDPQLAVITDSGGFKATIRGNVTGTTSGNKLGLQLVSRNATIVTTTNAADTSTSYSINATLYKPTASAELYALEWSLDSGGQIKNYIAYGRYASSLNLVAGGTLSNRNIALTPIAATHNLAVSTSGPSVSGMRPYAHFAGVRFADHDALALPLLSYVKYSSSGTTFTTRSPSLADAQMLVGAGYSNKNDLLSYVWESVPATATRHSLSAPDPVTLSRPAGGSTISVGSSLNWEGLDGALYLTYFLGDLSLTFITPGTAVTLPDLGPFGARYGNNAYTWQVYAFRYDGIMAGEMDQVVEPGKPSPSLMFYLTIFAMPQSESGYLVTSPKRTVMVH